MSNNEFTPVPNNNPGLGTNDFVTDAKPVNDPFTPLPSNDPGLGNGPSRAPTEIGFSKETFAQAYSQGFSQGFLQGFLKVADGEVQKALALAKSGFRPEGIHSEGFEQNKEVFGQQNGLQSGGFAQNTYFVNEI